MAKETVPKPADNGTAGQDPNPEPAPKVERQGPPGPDSHVSPFNPEDIRLPQNLSETLPIKKLLVTVPVRKPSDQTWFRTHSSPDYRQTVAMLFLKDDAEHYLCSTPVAQAISTEIVLFTLYLAITRQGTVFLFPIRVPSPGMRDNAYWVSAREAQARSETKYVRMRANRELQAYEITESEAKAPEPVWPEASWDAILKIAFRNHYISSLDHPVLQQLLRGE